MTFETISCLDSWNWSPVPALPHCSLYSMGGHRNLLKLKLDLATLLSTLQGLPILVGEKNPLTSGPLVFLHSLAWGTQTLWFSHTNQAPTPGPLPLMLLCQLLFFQILHGLPTMPLLRCHLLKEVFLITWKGSLCHLLSQYPVELFFGVLTLTCTWFFFFFFAYHLFSCTGIQLCENLILCLTFSAPSTVTDSEHVLNKSFLNDWMKWIFIP